VNLQNARLNNKDEWLLLERLANILSPIVTSDSSLTINLVLVPVVVTSIKTNRAACIAHVLYANFALQ
jgi:hypothetical protein